MLSNTVLASLVLILITTALALITQKQRGKRLVVNGESVTRNKDPTIIIAGPSNVGKTSLYTFLATGEHRNTVLSQRPSIAHDFKLSKATSFRLMEFPGHNKFQNQLNDALKTSNNIKGVVFMVDSTKDPKDLTETAEFLFQILQITESRSGGCDILLACNKSELFTARPPLKIREALEKELDRIIVRKRKSIETVKSSLNVSHSKEDNGNGEDNDEGIQDALLDLQLAGGFKFTSLEGNVDALEGSVTKNNTEAWECWMEERLMN